ncbi:MAG: helix-turn-helix transcriptional regulator [Gammaproteobacteria bacterium]
MHPFQVPATILEILSKAPGNPVLWHLFLAELAGAMHCDSGFLSIADLGRDGGIHHLYRYNVAPEQELRFEHNLRKSGSFGACVTKKPYRVFCFNPQRPSFYRDACGAEPDWFQEHCRFGVSLPLNRRYAHCMVLNGGRPAAETELHECAHRLKALVPPLQNALQKEQWFSLYHQITLLTGKHVAAYIIVDQTLNVLFSDPVFNRIIADMDCVEIRGKRLAFSNPATEQRVLASMGGIGCETVTLPNPCASCDITVIPARALDNLYAWEFYKNGVALTFTSRHENSPTLVRLMVLYNLTKGEALCALQFIATPSIPDIAAGTHRSTETVRNHIKSIMQKLDVHNQGALMKKLLAIAAL